MRISKSFGYLVAIICAFILIPVRAFAAEATVTFGSESYEVSSGKEFNIGVYIQSDESIGNYRVELEYDRTRLQYIDGGEQESDGVIVLEGTGFGKSIKYWLTMKAVSGGEAGIAVKSASVNQSLADGNEPFNIDQLNFAAISVSGNKGESLSFAEVLAERKLELEKIAKDAIENRYPVITQITVGNTICFVLDHSEYIPSGIWWDYTLIDGMLYGTNVKYLTDKNQAVYVIYLMDEDEMFHPYVVNDETMNLLRLHEGKDPSKGKYIYCTGIACSGNAGNIDKQTIIDNDLAYVIYADGSGELAQIAVDGSVLSWQEKVISGEVNETPSTDTESTEEVETDISAVILLVTVIVLMGAVIVSVIAFHLTAERNKKRLGKEKEAGAAGDSDTSQADDDFIVLEDEDSYVFLVEDDEPKEEDYQDKSEEVTAEQPVISIQNVTMKFKVSTSDASGLKEFLIQKIKKKVTYRELFALNGVSFDIYKGEVVGIIGTNGSGKSTLLRIVSGALRPTSGRVVVDRSKVQLLTLGTGFDMELTARENVYLNGAIIGYTKKFLDDHFDEIIEFAELQDFVDEKVKNFSSGMVSRLGFAIATAGDAAEILILDEVLSVGDEFFRKKSLARIKEMIHGGSTVLMVSHGMGTITENCTKAVWIEKGVLKMVGDTKTVCGKYQAMGGT